MNVIRKSSFNFSFHHKRPLPSFPDSVFTHLHSISSFNAIISHNTRQLFGRLRWGDVCCFYHFVKYDDGCCVIDLQHAKIK